MDATTYYHQLTDQRHENGSFDFDFTAEEIANSERILRDAASQEPDFSLSLSKGLRARFLCDSCKGHLFEAETFIINNALHHIGCGGKITICEF
jgi:hypothetical protein